MVNVPGQDINSTGFLKILLPFLLRILLPALFVLDLNAVYLGLVNNEDVRGTGIAEAVEIPLGVLECSGVISPKEISFNSQVIKNAVLYVPFSHWKLARVAAGWLRPFRYPEGIAYCDHPHSNYNILRKLNTQAKLLISRVS